MNVKLLKKIQKAILAEPLRFNMDHWIDTDNRQAPCGTTACIGGFAIILSDLKGKITAPKWTSAAESHEHMWGVMRYASQILEIDDAAAMRLFGEEDWPITFRNSYQSTQSPHARARIAVKRIQHFIDTKGTDVKIQKGQA